MIIYYVSLFLYNLYFAKSENMQVDADITVMSQ